MSDIREVKARLRKRSIASSPDIAALLADHDRLERERGGEAYSEEDVEQIAEMLWRHPSLRPDELTWPTNCTNPERYREHARCCLDLLADLRERCAMSVGGWRDIETIRSLPLLPEKP